LFSAFRRIQIHPATNYFVYPPKMGYVLPVAIFFLGMGIYGLVAPKSLIAPFKLQALNPESRSEVRAVYGGYGLFVGGLLIQSTLYPGADSNSVFKTVAVSLYGMAFGRFVSYSLVERVPVSFYPNWFYFFVELILASLLVLEVS
jgi:hypothetical protein